MKKILCISTEWFSKKGGLSTFNRRLCITLAKYFKVYCYMPDFDVKESDDASRHGVILIKPKYIAGMDPLSRMNNKPILLEGDKIDILIGHDRITGPTMEALRGNYYADAKTIFFIHTAPNEIEFYKPEKINIDHAENAEEKEKIQKDLAKNSSLIVAVGPKLFFEFKNSMAGVINKPSIIRFDPGLYEIPENINYDFESPIPEALLMGRLEDFHLKGVDIAFRAMNIVYDEWDIKINNIPIKPRLILRGSPSGSAKELLSKLNKLVQNFKLAILIRNYTSDVEVINEEIKRSAITLMPSRTEGFGLVALETISLGRPVLIGENTGLASLIKEIAPDEAHHWIIPSDLENDGVEKWAEKIRLVLMDRRAAGERLKRLIEIYSDKITWNSSVKLLMGQINNLSIKNNFYDSNSSKRSDLNFYGLPIWDSKIGEHGEHVGVKAEADFDFNIANKVITITRRNIEGRNILDILNYNSKNGPIKYIEHSGHSNIERKIRISFEAKVTGDPIYLFVIIHKKGDNNWHQHKMEKIENNDWQEFVIDKKVAADIDFTVQIQEKDFKGNPGKYEIRNYLVSEIMTESTINIEEQKNSVATKTYVHSNWKEKDISEDYFLTEKSNLYVKINLNQPSQKFVIYLHLIASDGNKYWLGFSGGLGTNPGKTNNEYTLHRSYMNKEVVFEENIFSVFKQGFSQLNLFPVRVVQVRLRGSDIDLRPIRFVYKIE